MGLWVPFSFKPLQGWGRLGLIVPSWFSETLCPKTVKGTQVLWPLYAAHINCNFFFTLFTCLCITGTSMPWYLCGAMGVGLFFIACGFQESNAGHQVWYQVPSLAKPSCKLTKKRRWGLPWIHYYIQVCDLELSFSNAGITGVYCHIQSVELGSNPVLRVC